MGEGIQNKKQGGDYGTDKQEQREREREKERERERERERELKRMRRRLAKEKKVMGQTVKERGNTGKREGGGG